MDILLDIVNAASDGSQSVEGPLLKAKVLAARLSNDALKEWVRGEIEGYAVDARLPDYREVEVTLRAHFAGYDLGSFRQQTLDVPLSHLPEKSRRNWRRRGLREGVRSLEAALRDSAGRGLQLRVPAEMRSILHDRVVKNAEVTRVWLEIAGGAVEGIISTVRSRLIDFAIAISEEMGGKPLEPLGAPPAIPPRTIQNNIANIYGKAGIVTLGSENVSVVVNEGDWDALARILELHGVSAEDSADLKEAVESEPDQKALGPRVAGWLANLANKAAETAVGGITKAVLGFYGVG